MSCLSLTTAGSPAKTFEAGFDENSVGPASGKQPATMLSKVRSSKIRDRFAWIFSSGMSIAPSSNAASSPSKLSATSMSGKPSDWVVAVRFAAAASEVKIAGLNVPLRANPGAAAGPEVSSNRVTGKRGATQFRTMETGSVMSLTVTFDKRTVREMTDLSGREQMCATQSTIRFCEGLSKVWTLPVCRSSGCRRHLWSSLAAWSADVNRPRKIISDAATRQARPCPFRECMHTRCSSSHLRYWSSTWHKRNRASKEGTLLAAMGK
mmetsp:Transcript_118860/g.343762  ORF Transcript_118860/g.343762 Transcript_118860/m.343762 type:complete len:265 (-) Transcript_118860:903-1697(-)